MSKGWHILRDGDSVTLCRQLPPRLEFAVQTVLPNADPVRLAHQIRQDMWRALQRVRGYAPVIRLDPVPEGWAVTAGGSASRAPAPAVMDRALAVLNDPGNRARWIRQARGAR